MKELIEAEIEYQKSVASGSVPIRILPNEAKIAADKKARIKARKRKK